MNINLLKPTIFPINKIVAGATLKNENLFHNGFSTHKTDAFSQEEIDNNKSILANNIGIPLQNLIYQKQIHKEHIQIITHTNWTTNESDGLITNEKELVLCLGLADCVGVLCYDPINNCVGAFHAGWRGTVAEIVPKGIELMRKTYNSTPKNILVYITPAAGSKKYEVENDVAKYFPNNVEVINNGKYLLNLKNEIVNQLEKVGVDITKNVEVSSICTISNPNFHSYRRDGNKSGRMTAFIGLK
jgi:YfiH family protein